MRRADVRKLKSKNSEVKQMISIKRTSVFNFENAVRGARNPMNSWEKSDSRYDEKGNYILGKNDLDLCMRLAKAGSDHRKYLRQIFVSVDINAPLYWWKEFDTYKVGTVANSCSTMHKIHAKEFELSDFSHERMDEYGKNILEIIIRYLNENRNEYNKTKDKQKWENMIQMLPTSYNQLRTVTLNYEVLSNMYHARKSHKLAEWHDFCGWIENLPYSELITGGKYE